MYAIVKIGGHQYKVTENQQIFVNKLSSDSETITLDQVLLLKDGKGKVSIGTPLVKDAKVEVKILDQLKADKVIIFKKKRRKGYRVKRGHRQPVTQLKIEKIS